MSDTSNQPSDPQDLTPPEPLSDDAVSDVATDETSDIDSLISEDAELPLDGDPSSIPPATMTAIQVPVYTGETLIESRQAADHAGLLVVVTEVEPLEKADIDGTVVAQNPPPGTPVLPGSVVSLDVVHRRSFLTKFGAWLLGGVALLALLALAFLIAADNSDTSVNSTTLPPDATTQNMQTVIDEQAVQIADLEAQVAQLAADLDAANDRLTGVDANETALAAERDAAVAERDAAAGQLNAAVAERDAAVAERDAAVAERDAAVAQLGDLSPVVAMPDFGGLTVAEVDAFAANSNVSVTKINVEQAGADGTKVISQSPATGQNLVPGSVIVVEVAVAPAN